MSKKYPKQLYVNKENAGQDDEYLSPSKKLEDVMINPGDTVDVAIYELKEVRQLRCRVELSPMKRRGHSLKV